jgi:ABC-type transport system involved in multi-copper enzyme maturation permease subunit
MNLPSALFAVRWLIRDTFRQARASGVTAAAWVVTAACTILCLSISVQGDAGPLPTGPGEDPAILPAAEAAKHRPQDLEGIDIPNGEMTFLFGAFPVRLARTRADAVRFVEVVLAGGIADTAGVLLALIWTAGFLPTFFDPATVTVLLAKPIPRWGILAGKVAGVIAFVAVQAILFIAAVWFALGVRTGIWDGRVFAAVPLLLIHFGCFYAVSALLAVTTRSTVVSVLGTVAVWLACWGVNYARHAAMAGGELSGIAGAILNMGYWVLPKPADLGILLLNAVQAQNTFGQAPEMRAALEQRTLVPELSLLTTCLLPLATFAFAAWRFVRAQY